MRYCNERRHRVRIPNIMRKSATPSKCNLFNFVNSIDGSSNLLGHKSCNVMLLNTNDKDSNRHASLEKLQISEAVNSIV